MAVAVLLNRTLILPLLTCFCDYSKWVPHDASQDAPAPCSNVPLLRLPCRERAPLARSSGSALPPTSSPPTSSPAARLSSPVQGLRA